MLKQLKVPGNLTRNHLSIMKKGVVRTGKMLIDMSTELAGLDSLEGKSVLDVGCGTRFTSAIINRNVPIRRYTGIDVYKPVIDYLKTNVEPHDERRWLIKPGNWLGESLLLALPVLMVIRSRSGRRMYRRRIYCCG